MVKYRLASESDNDQLVELAGTSTMSGNTWLRIERSPDFFRLLEMRGDSKVFVAVKNNKIIGSLCISLQNNYINGHIYPVHYIGDFKVLPEYQGSGIGNRLYDELAKYMSSIDADLCFLTVAAGNKKPLSFFKGRNGIPDFENIGSFKVHQLIGMRKNTQHSGILVELEKTDQELLDFLNHHQRVYCLGNAVTAAHLRDTEIYTIRDKGKMMAAMCMKDTTEAKQNVVLKMSWKDSALLAIVNSLRRPLGISKMPVTRESIRMINIKYLAAEVNQELYYKTLIRHAQKVAYDKSYSFISLGLHEKDPMNKYLPAFPKFTFKADGMLLSLKNNTRLIEQVKQGIPFEDFSLV